MVRDPRELLPLPSHDIQLLCLVEAPRHAYGLAKAVEGQTGGVRLEIGSLYRMLARLTSEGLIEDFDPPATAGGHEARRRSVAVCASPASRSSSMTIVAIARDVRAEGLDTPPRPTYYINQRQFPRLGQGAYRPMTVLVRVDGSVERVTAALQASSTISIRVCHSLTCRA